MKGWLLPVGALGGIVLAQSAGKDPLKGMALGFLAGGLASLVGAWSEVQRRGQIISAGGVVA